MALSGRRIKPSMSNAAREMTLLNTSTVISAHVLRTMIPRSHSRVKVVIELIFETDLEDCSYADGCHRSGDWSICSL